MSKTPSPPPGRRQGSPLWLGGLAALLWTLPALVFSSALRESFRLPKLLVTELLALGVLLMLAVGVRRVESIDGKVVLRHPAVLAFGPFLLVATLGLLTTRHPAVVAQGLTSLWIGAAACIGWSLALPADRRRPVLAALALPASLLALVAVGQYHGLLHLFEFRGLLQERIGLTSLAGGAFDLGAYLVLPALLAQLGLSARGESSSGAVAKSGGERGAGSSTDKVWERWAWERWAWGALLLLSIYGIALTRTLSALVALGLGSLVLWAGLVPRRRLLRVSAAVAVLAVVAVVAVTPLRQRLASKFDELRSGNVNRLLSGRLDGWKTALWMVEEYPLLGVGHGAYRSEFGQAKLALREEGVGFYRRQHQPYFVNAHNDALELVAETGLLGGLALLWGLGILGRALWRHRMAVDGLDPCDPRRRDYALMSAALVALAVMVSSNFPLRLALVAYPFLMVLSGVLRPPEQEDQIG